MSVRFVIQGLCRVRQARRQSRRATSRLMLLTDPTQTSAISGYLRARSFTCTATGAASIHHHLLVYIMPDGT